MSYNSWGGQGSGWRGHGRGRGGRGRGGGHWRGDRQREDWEERSSEGYGSQRGRSGSGNRYGRRETHRVDLPPDEYQDQGGERGQRGGRGRPPPGLKGREIGLWYAKKSQERKEREQKHNISTVSIDKGQEVKIRQLLTNLQQSDRETAPMPGPSSVASSTWDGAGSLKNKRACSDHDLEGLFPESSEEVPDQWEVRADSSSSDMEEDSPSFPVEVVPPSRESGDLGQEAAADEGDDMDETPSVAGVVQYMRSHGDYPYLGDEPESDFSSEVPQAGDPRLDQEMSETSQQLLHKPQFIQMLEFRKKLPSYAMRDTLVKVVRENQVVVISGETGCGKTTQVPQFILDDYIERGVGSQCRLICTQPRRISAISVAERVASERGDKVNDTQRNSVGYQIRLETKRPRSQGSILFCTTGIVLKFLEGDPTLERATHVIIDEIHERDLQSDFLMIILKELLPKRRDLKLILMSATLNAEMFSQYFNNCPMMNIPGYTFPVKEYLLEDAIEMTGFRSDDSQPPRRNRRRQTEDDREELENYSVWLRNQVDTYSPRTLDVLRKFDFDSINLDLIHIIINHICSKMEDGAILVFVPGWEEIKKLNEMLQSTQRCRSGCLRVIPLHSLMPTVNQREVFDRPPPGVRKIVIATNIAETSITIDDVVFVIDGGKIKVKDFNPMMNITSLEPQWVSKANAKQRRGRAGRVQSGYCFHLYTAFRYSLLRDYLPPEMLRTRLEELCLQIKLLKLGKIVPFISKAMQHPSMESISRAVDTLIELRALDSDENLLPLGYHLARLPVEPHTGKMILFGAMFCCLDPILTVAASLSFKDAFVIPLGKETEADKARMRLSQGSKSDHIMLINAFSGWEESLKRGDGRHFCWQNFLSDNTLRMLKDMKRQMAELLYDTGFITSKDVKHPSANFNSEKYSFIRAVLCAGLYPNVAQVIRVPKPGRKGAGIKMMVKDESRVVAHPKSVNTDQCFFESKWMVYFYKLKTSKIYIHDCTMVSPYPLLFFGGKIKILKENGTEKVSVDDWVTFKASASTAQLVMDLRQQLDKVLWNKITTPGPISWDHNTSEGALMTAIADLIKMEDTGQCGSGSIGTPPDRQHAW